MLNKDKRSFVFSMLLGDGCLCINKQQNTGMFVMEHGVKQADYVAWKAELLKTLSYGTVYHHPVKQGRAVRVAFQNKKFRVWKSFAYHTGKKDTGRILKYIRHPELAAAIWLMDDGYVEPNHGGAAAFRLFTCEVPVAKQQEIIDWWQTHFGVTPSIKFQKRGKHHYKPEGEPFPFLRFLAADSLKVWTVIRSFVLQHESMKHKFRYIEAYYQRCVAQRATPQQSGDDIVGPRIESPIKTGI